jgi:hypothetical protein
MAAFERLFSGNGLQRARVYMALTDHGRITFDRLPRDTQMKLLAVPTKSRNRFMRSTAVEYCQFKISNAEREAAHQEQERKRQLVRIKAAGGL